MEDCILEKVAGNSNHRGKLESDDQHDGICENGCDAERGNTELC